jgi:DNA-binding NarL/FixJ family response regulator
MRAALRSLLETWPEIEHVDELASVSDAVAMLTNKQPDLIVLDADNHADLGVAAVSTLLNVAQQVHIVLLSTTHNLVVQRQLIHIGAMGIVPKETPPEIFRKAIQRVLMGKLWIDRAETAHNLAESAMSAPKNQSPTPDRIGLLTKRERQVVTLIGEGLKNKQIALRLAISEPTVRHHLTSIFEKLGVKNRLELVIFAHRHDLAAPNSKTRSIS